MGLSERQTMMLEEMGIRVWSRPAAAPVALDPPARAARDDTVPLVDQPAPASARPRPAPAMVPVAAALPAARPAAEARPAAPMVARIAEGPIATLDWPALRDAVADCTACGLCEGRTQTVFGTGHERAHWMIVGEAPGELEDRQGEPFVGKSGQLLDNMLRALGVARTPGEAHQQVYIANAVKCHPPGNRNPEPQELARCEPYLMRQIALVQPRVILAMGRFAVQSLLRSNEPIGRLRGKVHTYQGVPLVVTYHPAYLLRNPEDKGRAWDDLCLAREALAGS